MDDFPSNLQRLLELIASSQHTVAFTGAGISTLSGIPDFRGRNGVYSKPWHGYAVEEILSIDCFCQSPELFYEWAREFVYHCGDFQPNAVHRVLAKMEQTGKLDGVYTQNIDLLHSRAGSQKVYELHGSPARHRCLQCGREKGYDDIAPVVMAGKVPRCPCGGVFKPAIVLYGEGLDNGMLEGGIRAFAEADLALVLGSSLTVYPAAMLPEAAARGRGKIVIVNASPTPLDRYAELHFDDLKQLFEALEEKL